ncbi:hypothetical protein QA641_09785 [Bradyrhizobium sp. CB1650]|uniref:FAD-dependent oxidoreductase n=1 Tax=Bradyrhizobium sp. CB1650 TaxID=3039153 RepID=UPI002435568B|nr:FAD-dependent oxidoreductase [Bradyrhizobium sp. CB1650]WGD54151.1 hypothetical protein QA641_09785 [Bradyrhizobium sp. CB1650]
MLRKLQIVAQNCTEPTSFHVQGVVRSLRFPRQARLHPTKYLAGLASAIQRRDADASVECIDQKQGVMVVKTTSGHEVRAAHVVVATNSPVNVRVAIIARQDPTSSLREA